MSCLSLKSSPRGKKEMEAQPLIMLKRLSQIWRKSDSVRKKSRNTLLWHQPLRPICVAHASPCKEAGSGSAQSLTYKCVRRSAFIIFKSKLLWKSAENGLTAWDCFLDFIKCRGWIEFLYKECVLCCIQ